MTTPNSILRIDASMRHAGSVTRSLTDDVVAQLQGTGATDLVVRDLTTGVPLIDESWINANFTPADARSDAQKAELAASDAFVAELQAADTIVIGAPIYNFSVPGALKAWIDQVARVGVTFAYTENGPKGLLEGKRAIVVVGSGGTPKGAPYDFATDYLAHVLGFIGISDVKFVDATGLMGDAEARLTQAKAAIPDAVAA